MRALLSARGAPALVVLCLFMFLSASSASAEEAASGAAVAQPPKAAFSPSTEPPPQLRPADDRTSPAANALAGQPSAQGPAEAQFAQLHGELAALTKTVELLVRAEERGRRHAAWVASRKEELRRHRFGPPIGFLVGAGLVMGTAAALLTVDPDRFFVIGVPTLIVGGLLAVTGIVTLTRVTRKRRLIHGEILRTPYGVVP